MAVRFVAACKKYPLGSLRMHLRVTANASKSREGVVAVADDAVEVCVAAQARDGAANRAVLGVLGEVIGVPRSAFVLSRGLKSREKTVVLGNGKGDGEVYATTILDLLRSEADK